MNLKKEILMISKIIGIGQKDKVTEDFSNQKVYAFVFYDGEGNPEGAVNGKYRILGKGKMTGFGDEIMYILENPKDKKNPIWVPLKSVKRI